MIGRTAMRGGGRGRGQGQGRGGIGSMRISIGGERDITVGGGGMMGRGMIIGRGRIDRIGRIDSMVGSRGRRRVGSQRRSRVHRRRIRGLVGLLMGVIILCVLYCS